MSVSAATHSRISFISGRPARFKVPIEVTSLACQLKLRCAVVNRSQFPTGWHPLFGSARLGLRSTPTVAEKWIPSQKCQRCLLIRNCAIDDAMMTQNPGNEIDYGTNRI